MLPIEKAIKLVNKMDKINYMKLQGKNKNSKGLPISMYDSQKIECAIELVNEVLLFLDDGTFYNQVKTELKKML